ncbi:hypothetical protein TNCV_2542931 [Trichonephila clavipes]|nr:hypothetical protein TNCV_2542931 [Trichonephila clavipes]
MTTPGSSFTPTPLGLEDNLEWKVLYIGYVKGVHSSPFYLGNPTPSLGELAGSISAVRLLIRNLLGSKSTLIRELPGISDSQVYCPERPQADSLCFKSDPRTPSLSPF